MTAELAAAMPVLVLVVAAAIGGVGVAGARVRVQDAAREAARAAARGDITAARGRAEHIAPGADVAIRRDGDSIVATARLTVHPLGDWLPELTVTETAIAAAEPTGR